MSYDLQKDKCIVKNYLHGINYITYYLNPG